MDIILFHPDSFISLITKCKILNAALIYFTVRKAISISEAKAVKMPAGQIKWLPSQRALLREIVVINLMGALNCSGRLMCGMC